MTYQVFYSELGKLLYAIAKIDGNISKKEAQKIREIIETRLVPTEGHKDRFGSNVAYYTEIEFDILNDEIANPETALDSFINYVEEHYTAFDDQVLDECVQIVKDVAAAYNNISTKEAGIIERLENKFRQIKAKRLK